MAKLQKSLKQRQRQAVRNSPNVAKLTPAEIRSLNNSALASKVGSQTSSQVNSPARSRRSTNATPPTSPDNPSAYHTPNHRHSVSRNASIDVPTPPHTPTGRRRSSQSSTHSHHHAHPHAQGPVPIQGHFQGVIHAPRPRGSAHAAFMVANGISSRPSSSGSSSYRGLPTYRGPEVTRTGSINMLQRPSPTIVANPLSYFSRPRQSVVSSSPEQSRPDAQDASLYQDHSPRDERANSLPAVSAPSSRGPSPARVVDSPVSFVVDETEKFPVLDPPDDPHNQPKIQSDDETPQSAPTSPNDEQLDGTPTSPISPSNANQSASPKKEGRKRFTLSAAIFGTDKGNQNGGGGAGKLRKVRRRTLSFSKSIDKSSQATESPPREEIIAPTEEDKVDEAATEDGGFATHPAVRPLSIIIPADSKGKTNEIHSAPVYARCDCCGRLKRPPGSANGLSPVMENEHVRTNFSFEIERTSDTTGRRSSDSSRGKFVHIIPMQVGENQTCQASIEPYSSPATPTRRPNQHTTGSPARSRKHVDPPRFVRFASLHGRRSGDSTVINEEDEDEVGEDEHLLKEQPGNEFSEVKSHDFALDEAASQPVLETEADQIAASMPVREMEGNPTEVEDESNDTTEVGDMTDSQQHRLSNGGSEYDTFFTPARGTTPIVETHRSENQGQQTPSNRDKTFLGLPEPSLGPHFARSSATLRDLVLATTNLTSASDASGNLDKSGIAVGDAPQIAVQGPPVLIGLDADRHRGQKWVAEVMAV